MVVAVLGDPVTFVRGDDDFFEEGVEDGVGFGLVVVGEPVGEEVEVGAEGAVEGVEAVAAGLEVGGCDMIGVFEVADFGGEVEPVAFVVVEGVAAEFVGVFEAGELGAETVEAGAGRRGGFHGHGDFAVFEVGPQGAEEFGACALKQEGVGDDGVLGGVGGAAPDEAVGAGAVFVAPEGGVACAAFEEAGELVVFAALIIAGRAGAAIEFGEDGFVVVEGPEGLMDAGVADGALGVGAVAGVAVAAAVFVDAGDFEADEASVERVA